MAYTESSIISITGAGLVSPLGLTVEQTWENLLACRDAMGPMPALEWPLPPGKNGGQAVDLPPDFAPELPREARYLRYAIESAWRSAGLDAGLTCDPSRVHLILGTTLHGMRAGGRFLRTGDHSELKNFLAGDISQRAIEYMPVGGGSVTTCSACSSSLGSIALGVTLLQSGQADVVIAGGYDAVSEYAWAGFNSLRLVSEPPLRPFARGRVGMKLSEAYAIVILQRQSDAKREIATIAGWGESADAHHLTQPHPSGDGAMRAMFQAMGRAGIMSEDLGLISAHATGTPDNDTSEAAALLTLLGENANRVPVAGLKSHLGHTLGGAGAAELILSAMALKEQIAPPTAHVEPANCEFPALQITHGSPRPADIRYTLNTSLGFGGANTCVVLAGAKAGETKSVVTPAISAGVRRRAVITGIGILLPNRIGNEPFTQSLEKQLRFDPSATLVDADYEHLLNARRTRRMSTYVKMTLAAATLAIADAKLEAGFDASCILGTMHGSAAYSHEYYGQIVREGLLSANPMLFAEGVPNAAAAQLSLMLGLKQACQTFIGTRTSGLDAMRFAAMRIESGACDRVIVSGGEENYAVVNDAYGKCGLRGETGFMNQACAVTLIVESSETAESRQVRSYGTIAGGASVSASPRRLSETIERLLPDRQVLVTSGNRTWVGDAEDRAITRRWGEDGHQSVRNFYPMIGELFSAHGLASLAAMLLGESTGDFGVLCSDFSGVASMLQVVR